MWKSGVRAVCGENKRARTPVEDKQAFQRYDISIIPEQDMNSSVILIARGGGGCIVEQEVLRDMCCTW